jgi:tetratricopeptide (TPR) repeat protein
MPSIPDRRLRSDKLDDFGQAEPVARELIAMEPSDPTTYRILSKLYEDQGRYDEAEKELLDSIQAKPSDAMGYQMLAAYYSRRGDFAKTIEAWNKRAAAEPKNPEAWHMIGVTYQIKILGDKKLARATALEYALKGIEAEDKALSLSPDYYEATIYKNILLRHEALYEKDQTRVKQLLEEADRLLKRAEELKKRATGGTEPAKPEAGKGRGGN